MVCATELSQKYKSNLNYNASIAERAKITFPACKNYTRNKKLDTYVNNVRTKDCLHNLHTTVGT